MVLAGATLQFPGLNRLVIDAGTCVTLILSTSDKYLGAIAPGLRYKSLHDFTAKLPLFIFGES
jgi:type III pantothenate kinase